jgi:hypothetical protein
MLMSNVLSFASPQPIGNPYTDCVKCLLQVGVLLLSLAAVLTPLIEFFVYPRRIRVDVHSEFDSAAAA